MYHLFLNIFRYSVVFLSIAETDLFRSLEFQKHYLLGKAEEPDLHLQFAFLNIRPFQLNWAKLNVYMLFGTVLCCACFISVETIYGIEFVFLEIAPARMVSYK